jgi:hypothetical protein
LNKKVRRRKAASRKYLAGKELKATLREKGVRRVLWMLRVPTSFSEVKGLVSEEKALRAFEYFQLKKVVFPVGVITKITPTIHYSEDDRKGIDLMMEFQGGGILFVEVKNRRNLRLERDLRRRNRCLIAIPWETADKEVRKIVLEAVNRFFQKRGMRREEQKGEAGRLVGVHH